MNKEFYNNYFHLHHLCSNMTGIKPNKIYQVATQRSGLNRNLIYYTEEMINGFIKQFNLQKQEQMENEYRKFIEENKYGRIGNGRRTLSVPRVQLT